MFQFKSGYLIPLFLCLFAFAQAYRLDPDGSCDGIQIDLVQAIEKASGMAKKASSELGKGFLQNKDVKALSENLFKPGDTKSVKSLLSAISTEFMKPETSENKRSPIIYCNFDRLRPLPDAEGHSNFLYDTQNDVRLLVDAAHKMCEGQKINGRRAKAYTVTWMKANLPDRQDYMQLCPWWLDEVSQQEHLMSNLPPDSEIKNTDFPYRDPSQEMPWMDIYMPVEQSLVHEFSHSYLGGKGISKDHEYQWTQCVSLSDGSQRCSNADSIGFFALGVEMIKNKGQRITREGNFQRINSR